MNSLHQDRHFFDNFDETVKLSPSLDLLFEDQGLDDFNFSLNVSEESRDKNIVGSREHFGKVVKIAIDLTGRRHDCDGRNKSSIGSHKPDYLLRSDECAGEQSIVVVGDIKGIDSQSHDCEFPDEDVGQILNFMQEVLIKQGWRQRTYGFLTDAIRFEFFLGIRDKTQINFKRSGLLSKNAGWTRLSHLLQQTDEILGFKSIAVKGWDLGEWLGSGATSSTFAAASEDGGISSAVCKIYTCGKEAEKRLENERRALLLMKDDKWTPKIAADIFTTAGAFPIPILLVMPRGYKLGVDGVRLPISAFSKLVRTLQTSHSRNLFHLDVCPDNMFAVKTTERERETVCDQSESYFVLLNDWGSSMTSNEVSTKDMFSTHKLYYDVNNMGAGQDLAALVRSVYRLTQCTFSPARVHTTGDLDFHIRNQWSWGVTLDAALQCNYDAVEMFLSTGSAASTGSIATNTVPVATIPIPIPIPIAFAALSISAESCDSEKETVLEESPSPPRGSRI